MPKFRVKTSNHKISARINKLLATLSFVTAVTVGIVSLVFSLPVPNELLPVIFTEIPLLTVLLAIGITGGIIILLIIQFGIGRYRKVILDINDDVLEIQQSEKTEKYKLLKINLKEPEYETNKPELKLTIDQKGFYIRFQSHYELRYFQKLIKFRRQFGENELKETHE